MGPVTPDLLRVQVRAIRMEAEGVHAFELVDPSGAELPPALAGAHVDVHLPALPTGGLVRPYSLASDPADRTRYVLGVLRETQGCGGSRAMHEHVRVGSLLMLGAPRNAFALHAGAGRSILIAGGIGITPLKAMAHALAREGADFELHYCARSARHAAFVGELRALVPPDRLHLHFDGGEPARGLDIQALLRAAPAGTHVYYCGPGGFMQACAVATAHWPPGQVHCEHFKPVETPAGAGDNADTGFDVTLARSGITVHVAPEQSIVRAIELAGLRVPTSCLAGLCGSCKVDVIEGDVDHRDYILSDEEHRHCMTLCVSRAKGATLVVDF